MTASSESERSRLDQLCINAIRMLSIDAVQRANSGHPGMPMGAATMAFILWTRHLRHNPRNPSWPDRDRFVLSAGHGSMLAYATLNLAGYARPTMDDIRNFRQLNSPCAGHPENFELEGVETTTGPLGQGLATAVGMAIAERRLRGGLGRLREEPREITAERERDGRRARGRAAGRGARREPPPRDLSGQAEQIEPRRIVGLEARREDLALPRARGDLEPLELLDDPREPPGAVRALQDIYRPGFNYVKAGVTLVDLRPAGQAQGELDLFGDGPAPDAPPRRSADRLMNALDALNQRFGRGTVGVASAMEPVARPAYQAKRERMSPRYTSRIDEIPIAR